MKLHFIIACLIVLSGVATTRANFVSTPTSVNATLGSTATFNCSANATRVAYVWLVNGFLLTELNGGITTYQDENTSFLRIPAREEYSNASVVCELTIRDSVRSFVLSDPAVLKVQGLLAAVENLTVHSHPSFVLLTWVRPFSLDITGVDPDLWYCVEVYNITWGRAPLTTNCSVYEPHFYFTAPNPSPCDLFEFTVFAVNAVRNGSVASVNGTFFKKPALDVDGIRVTFLSPVEIKVEILFSSPLYVCSGQLLATNMTANTSLDTVETGLRNLVFVVKSSVLQFNLNYTITFQVGERESSVLGNLSTFDIKTALGNNCSSPGRVNVSCTFATNSQALGCLVVLHPWKERQIEMFAYAARDNDNASTADISILGVPKGGYSMLVFDGEYNGQLSEQAAITPQNVTVTEDGDLEPVIENSGPSASINTTDDKICVSCPDDGVSKGCVVVLRLPQKMQSTLSYEIPRSEEGRCFPQKQSGEYTVAVFKQIMRNALQEKPLNVSMVTISISTQTTSTSPSTTSPIMPNRDDMICASGCIAGIVVFVIATCAVIGAVVIFVMCWRKHRAYKFTLALDVPDAPETPQTTESQVSFWNGGPSLEERYTNPESLRLVTDGAAESPQTPDLPPPTYDSVTRPEAQHFVPSAHGTADEANQSQHTNQQPGLHYADLEVVIDSKKVKPPPKHDDVQYSDVKTLPEKATILGEESTPLPLPNQVPLNLNSVTPKDGVDQCLDIHPRRTLPVGAMFEESTPPPLPTKTCQGRPLTLETLFTELHPTVTPKWQKLGQLLAMDEDLLDEIFTINETDEECLKAVLEVWLQKSANLTWRDVTHALKKIEENENNGCASCDCDVEDATEEEGDKSEPPVSDETVSRKPSPHRPQHSSGVSTPQESQLLSVGSSPRGFGDFAGDYSHHEEVTVPQELIEGPAAQCFTETTDTKGADALVNGYVSYNKEHVNFLTHAPSGRSTYSTQLPIYAVPGAEGNPNWLAYENLALQNSDARELPVEDFNAANQGVGSESAEESTKVGLKDEFSDLCKLEYEWHNLGIQLEVRKPQLTKQVYQRIDELFLAWSNRVKSTWMKVVQALVDNGKTLWIAHEYGLGMVE